MSEYYLLTSSDVNKIKVSLKLMLEQKSPGTSVIVVNQEEKRVQAFATTSTTLKVEVKVVSKVCEEGVIYNYIDIYSYSDKKELLYIKTVKEVLSI